MQQCSSGYRHLFIFFAHGRYILGGGSYDLKENVDDEQMSAGGILISVFTDTMNGKE